MYCIRSLIRLSVVLSILLVITVTAKKKNVKIGIIGGGIGGTSAGYFLRQELEPLYDNVEIDLFESHEIGGRLKNIEIDGKMYESGGSIIHPDNQYMQHFTRKFGLSHRDANSEDTFGLYNGKSLVFSESSWSLLTAFKLIWRYKLDALKLQWDVNDMLYRFSRIYDLQKEGHAFTNVQELLSAMNEVFLEQMNRTFAQELLSNGYSKQFLSELAAAAINVNYGQNVNIPAFAGFVSIAGAQSGLWAVKGGNVQVPETLLLASKARLERGTVHRVQKIGSKYRLFWKDAKVNDRESANYDAIIVAFPLDKDRQRVSFDGVTVSQQHYGPMHRNFATFVRGIPRYSNWCPSNTEPCPNDILCTDAQIFYSSLGMLLPVNWTKDEAIPAGNKRVFKVFSHKSLSDSDLQLLFESVEEKKEIPWLAYPHYQDWSKRPGSFEFELAPGLFYANAIEWAASAMEMAVIGARNVALLAKYRLTSNHTMINVGFAEPRIKAGEL